MNEKRNMIQSGTIFTATDKLGRKYRYMCLGIDLNDVQHGTGCQYIVLKNLDTHNEVCVEAQWFRERTIVLHGCYKA